MKEFEREAGNESVLTPERILEAAEDALRRFGPTKTTVVDVARLLGVSHGSVYRHFPSKAALRDAVTERWLSRVSTPLGVIAAQDESATARLRCWFDFLIAFKRKKASEDSEMFSTYMAIATDAREVIKGHVDLLVGQVSRIISDGIARGEFAAVDPEAAGRAVFDATARFHNPTHASEWTDPNIDSQFESVWSLVLSGLASRG